MERNITLKICLPAQIKYNVNNHLSSIYSLKALLPFRSIIIGSPEFHTLIAVCHFMALIELGMLGRTRKYLFAAFFYRHNMS